MRTLVCVMCVALAAGTAGADEIDDAAGDDVRDVVTTIAKRALQRTRRSLTLGPMVGLAPGATTDDGELAMQVSVGVGLVRYDIPPLPSSKRIQEIIKGRARAVFEQRLKAAIAGGAQPSDEDRRRFAREVWEEIKAELLLETRPRRFEKPSFELMLEVLHTLDSDIWDLRLTAGLGVGPVFVAAGTSLQYDDGAALAIPFEVSVPILLSKGLRAPLAHPFIRYELAATDRDDRGDRVFVGARFALDVL